MTFERRDANGLRELADELGLHPQNPTQQCLIRVAERIESALREMGCLCLEPPSAVRRPCPIHTKPEARDFA